jgi:hypothetical protein
VPSEGGQKNCRNAERIEPSCLIEVREKGEPHGGIRPIPHTIMIRSHAPEEVFPRLEAVVIDYSTCASLNPAQATVRD